MRQLPSWLPSWPSWSVPHCPYGGPAPSSEWALLLAPTTLTLALAQARIVESWRESGIGLVFANTTLDEHHDPAHLPVAPPAGAGYRRLYAAGEPVDGEPRPGAAASLGRRAHLRPLLRGRAFHVGAEALERVGRSMDGGEASRYAGALGELLLVGLVGAAVVLLGRRARHDKPTVDDSAEAAEERGRGSFSSLLPHRRCRRGILLAAMTAQVASPGHWGNGLSAAFGSAGNWLLQSNTAWRLIVAGLALVAAVPLALLARGGWPCTRASSARWRVGTSPPPPPPRLSGPRRTWELRERGAGRARRPPRSRHPRMARAGDG